MKNYKSLVTAAISVLMIVTILLGCDTLKGPLSQTITVKMKNNASDNVHMWIETESIGPSNKLVPGGSRSATFTVTYDSTSSVSETNLKIYAGRNGETLDYLDYTVARADGDISVKVQFTDDGLKYGN